MNKIFTFFLCFATYTLSFGQWSSVSLQGKTTAPDTKIQQHYSLDIKQLKSTLSKASESGKTAAPIIVKIPTLSGKIERFAVYSAPVVVKSLADRLDLGSYAGVGLDDPTAYIRFSLASNDFQSMMLKNGVYEFIQPENVGKSVYGVSPKSTKSPTGKAFVCSTQEDGISQKQIEKMYSRGKNFANNPMDFSKSSDRKYRTLRLALSTTAEYTNYFGSVNNAFVAINATLTRVNFVFEKDFALKVILQDFPQLIYTNPATDPYSNSNKGADGTWSTELQNHLTNEIGNAAYDIGHLFGATGGGGNAGCIGCICTSPTIQFPLGKGSAYTSPADGIPFGDTFDIDYVAHEMGHQLGANHTWSFETESTGQNVEPGSGSTIMGYAGITSADVQGQSDPYFHINSIIQIQNNLVSKSCDIETSITNNSPVIDALSPVTIPKGTAFVLTAQATDLENDPLTYTWEQTDNATSPINKSNLGKTSSGATFRSVIATANPTRYFPKLETVLSGLVSNPQGWEAVSSIPRNSEFTVTVRDNNPIPSQQQTSYAVKNVTVSNNGPFKITSDILYNNDPKQLTWDVVGTNIAPFNVQNVKIDYTTDDGLSWTVLSASTPNDGTEYFDFSSFSNNSMLKIRISAIGNVFYAVAPITIISAVSCDGNAPALFTVSDIKINSAVLSWDVVSGATYILRYKKSSEVVFTEIPLSTTSYQLLGLTQGTNYDVQVAAVCSGTTGNYTAIKTFTSAVPVYCTAGTQDGSYEKISNVTFANINNTSTSMDGYENFTNIVGNVIAGQSYTFTAQNSELSYNTDEVRVWIDFNNDKDFDDADELVLITPIKDSPWTGTIMIPTNATKGQTRMRIRLQDTNATKNDTPCDDAKYGQVEDYTLEIGTLAVNESSQERKIQLYPNPVTDILNISNVSDKAEYAIYSISGQLIKKGKIIKNKISVAQLQQGLYLINVDDNANISTLKFIKK